MTPASGARVALALRFSVAEVSWIARREGGATEHTAVQLCHRYVTETLLRIKKNLTHTHTRPFMYACLCVCMYGVREWFVSWLAVIVFLGITDWHGRESLTVDVVTEIVESATFVLDNGSCDVDALLVLGCFGKATHAHVLREIVTDTRASVFVYACVVTALAGIAARDEPAAAREPTRADRMHQFLIGASEHTAPDMLRGASRRIEHHEASAKRICQSDK